MAFCISGILASMTVNGFLSAAAEAAAASSERIVRTFLMVWRGLSTVFTTLDNRRATGSVKMKCAADNSRLDRFHHCGDPDSGVARSCRLECIRDGKWLGDSRPRHTLQLSKTST